MPKLKLHPGRTLRAGDHPTLLFAVHVKPRYGWISDTDTTLMVLADSHDQARRRAAAELIMREGVSLPLDDAHFCETLVGEVENEQPEVSPAEFQQMWQAVNHVHTQHADSDPYCNCPECR
ncbi:hypothetical protein D3C81_1330480 [compost metagenome]